MKTLKYQETGITLTKKKINVVILSTLQSFVDIAKKKNKKNTLETIKYYNEMKYGIYITDQMTRKYSLKAFSRR